jgi:general secretion pathway protein C
MFVDLALAVLTVFVAYQVFTKLFQPPVSAVGTNTNSVEAAAPTLPTVASRENYNVIVTSRLFGAAGETKKETGPETQGDEGKEVEPTVFTNLKLKGTSFTKVRPNALIEQAGGITKVYQPGEEIIPGQARLDEVHNRWVYLFNLQKKQREILKMHEDEQVMASSAAPEAPAAGKPEAPGRKGVTIKRDELETQLQDLTNNMADVVAKTNPHPVTGPDGKVQGFTADNLSGIPLAQKLGFKDGDIVKEINGLPIDSMDSVTDAISKFENANDFRVTVLRNGTPTLLRFKLE